MVVTRVAKGDSIKGPIGVVVWVAIVALGVVINSTRSSTRIIIRAVTIRVV